MIRVVVPSLGSEHHRLDRCEAGRELGVLRLADVGVPIDQLARQWEVAAPHVDRRHPEQQAAVELRRRVRLGRGRTLERLVPAAEQVELAEPADQEDELPAPFARPPGVLERFVDQRDGLRGTWPRTSTAR